MTTVTGDTSSAIRRKSLQMVVGVTELPREHRQPAKRVAHLHLVAHAHAAMQLDGFLAERQPVAICADARIGRDAYAVENDVGRAQLVERPMAAERYAGGLCIDCKQRDLTGARRGPGEARRYDQRVGAGTVDHDAL